MKKIGFLSFGHWSASRQSATPSAYFSQGLARCRTCAEAAHIGVSIDFALMNDQDRAYFGRDGSSDQIGIIDNMRAVFGRTYAAEPDALIEELGRDEATAEADTRLLTVPNTLGVDYNVHVIESILTHIAPASGWR